MKHRFLICYLIVCLLAGIKPAYSQLPLSGLCAHRGAMDTHPENTIPAFEAAILAGAQMIEFDVWQTRDGQLVVIHDPTVDRTTDGTGKVSDLSWAEIRRLDAGSWKGEAYVGTRVPLLKEVLDRMPRNIWLNIHLKDQGTLSEEVVTLLQSTGRLNQAFLACGRQSARKAKSIAPSVLICNMDRRKTNDRYARQTIRRNADFIQLTKNGGALSPSMLRKLDEKGIRVNYFPVADLEEAASLFKSGVDFPLVNDIVGMMKNAKSLGIVPVQPEY